MRAPLLAVVLAALAALAGCGGGEDSSSADAGPAGTAAAGLPEGVVAEVDGVPITAASLQRTVAQSRAEASASGEKLPRPGEQGYDQVERLALQSLVQQVVVGLEAEACGAPCEVTEADVDAEAGRIIKANFDGSYPAYRRFLRQRKINDAEAAQIIRSQLEQQALFDRRTRGVRGTKAKERAFSSWSEDVLARYAKRTVYTPDYGPPEE